MKWFIKFGSVARFILRKRLSVFSKLNVTRFLQKRQKDKNNKFSLDQKLLFLDRKQVLGDRMLQNNIDNEV